MSSVNGLHVSSLSLSVLFSINVYITLASLSFVIFELSLSRFCHVRLSLITVIFSHCIDCCIIVKIRLWVMVV